MVSAISAGQKNKHQKYHYRGSRIFWEIFIL